MKKTILFCVAWYSLFASAVPTVAHVDLNRYLGRWYEIASIPAWFQRKCVKNTMADYAQSSSNSVDVVNGCEREDGRRSVANGTAFVVNAKTQAELKVSFVPLLRYLGWFAGSYKILALGERYEYAVVGEDSLKYAWILAREPKLSTETLRALAQILVAAGYDSCKLLTSVQDGGAFTKRTPLCESVR